MDFKLRFEKISKALDHHKGMLALALRAHKDDHDKYARITDRYVFMRNRADGSRTVLDASAIILALPDGTRFPVLLTIHGTHDGDPEKHEGDQYSTLPLLDYTPRSYSIRWGMKGMTLAAARKATPEKIAEFGHGAGPGEFHKRAKSLLNMLAHNLRDHEFYIARIGKRLPGADFDLRWYGVNENWRYPKSEVHWRKSARARRAAITRANKWVQKSVDEAHVGGEI